MRKTHFLQISILLLGIVASQTCDRCICPCSQTYCTSVSSKTWVSVFSYSSYGYTKLVLSNDGNSCRPCTYNCKVLIIRHRPALPKTRQAVQHVCPNFIW